MDKIWQITGAIWYLLAVERNDTCWREACIKTGRCKIDYLYCDNKHMEGFPQWQKISGDVLNSHCSVVEDDSSFNYGIYTQAISSRIVESRAFFSKFFYCLWWGVQNLRYFAFSFFFFLSRVFNMHSLFFLIFGHKLV